MANHDPELYAEWQRETKANGPGGEAVTGYIGQRSNIAANGHREGWLRDQCVQWLKGEQATEDVVARDPKRPLCLYFSLDFPHAGLNPPAEFEDLYDIDDIVERPLPPWAGQGNEHRPSHLEGFFEAWQELSPEQRRRTTLRYYAATSYVDSCFQTVVDTCREQGLMDDALIVFTADHGEMLGDRSHRFSKYCLYDPSVRVPLVVSGSRVPADLRGQADERPAELIDILPTICRQAGAPIREHLPGGDLLGAPLPPRLI